jgi:hypothetical protein
MISEQKLLFWIDNGYNVIFKGKHGVGKTSIVLDAFQTKQLRYRYFSASTMDPWVDFIGVPKEHTDENGKSFLDLVRPKEFAEDEVEALFFDEMNRAPKKIRNAIMELIQFKSINGKKFNNLKIVWAAINPDDDEDEKYDVDELDPAQLDRFHAIIEIPYRPYLSYFKQKYGSQNASVAIDWWKALPKQTQNLISPRRLDYALDFYTKNGDVRDVLPKNANVDKLLLELKQGPTAKIIEDLFENKDEDKARQWIQNENSYAAFLNIVSKKDTDILDFFLPLISEERLTALISKTDKATKGLSGYILKNSSKFEEQLINVIKSQSQDSKLMKKLQSKIPTSWFAKNIQGNIINSRAKVKLRFLPYEKRQIFIDRLQDYLDVGGNISLDNIDCLYNSQLYNTFHREQMYSSFANRMPKSISNPDIFWLALFVFDSMLKRSQCSTVSRMEHTYVTAIEIINSILQMGVNSKIIVDYNDFLSQIKRQGYVLDAIMETIVTNSSQFLFL